MKEENQSKLMKDRPSNETESTKPFKPAFINCSHPISKCHCMKRSISQEKLKPQTRNIPRTRSVNSIKNVHSRESLDKLVGKSKEKLKSDTIYKKSSGKETKV